ncbi:Alpha-N-acetylgalactosaminidase [Stylophora pistillata]|uniref:Alpha-galactosidase n=1 Tax=Stylophora pistillata TaxID=50429 RepID=A0A2B4RML4_STYPI|nr:Alpha-N-acetylgalactosaminidase [Stylophora pistillata]
MASWQENLFVKSLDNGLALTPPMGWMDWERFRCNTDCKNDPDNCIGEKLFMDMASRMAEDGFKDVGYEYVSIDDCWMSHNRTADGQLQPDPARFPSGMKALADYIHSKGLKLGIYAGIALEDLTYYGTKTCAGYPGTIDHIQQDMDTFAGWGVDYLKLDGCYSDPDKMDTGYPMVTKALNNTGRPIVFSCSWPAYQSAKKTPNYTWIAENCNLWRNYDDIQDSWQSVTSIVKWYGDHQDEMIPVAGPGNWNDPDMLIIGDFSLSFEQSKAQFALWSVMASEGNREIWARPLSNGSVAVVLFSHSESTPETIEASFKMVGLSAEKAEARDLFEHKDLGTFTGSFHAIVNPSGVVMVILSPVTVLDV